MSIELSHLKKCQELVHKVNLNLKGTRVLTECASGGYLYTPILALMAGAERVFAYGRDTRFGSFKDNETALLKIAKHLNLTNRITCISNQDLLLDAASEIDFATNSGMLRPFTRDTLARFKPGAFVSLMWEPWEFRPGDIDLEFCQQNNIPIVGANELGERLSMENYPFFLFTKGAHAMDCMIANQSIAVVGGFLTGQLISQKLTSLGVEHKWFAKEPNDHAITFESMHELLSLDNLDLLVFAEHLQSDLLIGEQAAISFRQLKNKFPSLKVVHICGNVDAAELKGSELQYYPANIQPFGYMSFQPADFSVNPALELNTIGLKAAEVFGRAFRPARDYQHAIKTAIDAGYALDFAGGFFNYKARDIDSHSMMESPV